MHQLQKGWFSLLSFVLRFPLLVLWPGVLSPLLGIGWTGVRRGGGHVCVCQGVGDEGQKTASSGTVRNDLSLHPPLCLHLTHNMQILIQRRAGESVLSLWRTERLPC